MPEFQKTRIKICCIGSVAEANLAIRYGADAIGLVSAMPSGPGVIPEEKISEIARHIPPGVTAFLLTSKQNISEIVGQHLRCRVNTLQLVDSLPDEALVTLHRELPGVALVKVIHVTGPGSIDDALHIAPLVSALLLDSGNPFATVRELGGTGRVHDWEISRAIVQRSPVPVFLAGGLHAGNVGEAIRAVHPFGVDVCSGVRTEGRLDEVQLSAFVNAVRDTDVRVSGG